MTGNTRRPRWRTRTTAALAVTLAVTGAGSAAGATLQVLKGGYRNVGTNTSDGYANPLAGAILEQSTSSSFPGVPTAFPATDANGLASLTVSSGTHYAREKTAPAGWQKISSLNWGDSSPATDPYIGSRNLSSSGSTGKIQIDGDDHRFVNALVNPDITAACGTGIRVLLLMDTSGSTSGYGDEYNAAAKAFISTLSGTPTTLKISSFATTSSPGAAEYDLSTPAGRAAAESRVNTIYPNDSSGSGLTNWDAALQDAAKANVDVIVFVTDGNPTTNASGSSSSGTSIDDVVFGVASANLAKNPDKGSASSGDEQRMLAVGVGNSLGVQNLMAVSGPTDGVDYTTASDPSALAATLRAIAEKLCPADLAVVKTGPASAEPGQSVTYDVTVTNNGASPIPFSAITVTDPGATLAPPDPAPKELGAGESAIWKATRTVDSTKCGSQFPNTANVSLNLPGYEEKNLADNTSIWNLTVICPVDLSVKKTGDATVLPGGVISYDIVVTNDGKYPIPYSSIGLKDDGADTLDPPVDPPAFLEPGKSLTWKATRTAPKGGEACGTTVSNTADVGLIDTKGYVEKDTAGNSSTFQSLVNCPVDLSVTKTGTATVLPGGVISYDIAVKNEGSFPVPSASIKVTDADADPGSLVGPKDPPEFLVPGETLTWTATRTAPGGQAACGTEVSNTADVALSDTTGYVEPDTKNNSSTFISGIDCPLDVGILKSATNGPVQPGETATYDVVVTNTGAWTVPFSAIKVTDPGATTLTPPDDTSDLLAGASRTWTATLAVPEDATCGVAVENTAEVALIAAQVPSALRASIAVEPQPETSTASTPVSCPVSVSLTKAATTAAVSPGGEVSYTLDVTNTGKWTVPFESVLVSDPGATLTPPADTSPLAPGATRTWTASKSVVEDAAVCGAQVANSATATLVDLPEGYVAPEEAQVSSASPVLVSGGICAPGPVVPTGAPAALLRPAESPTLTVTKVGPARAFRGGILGYRIRVSNTGTTDATGVSLRDLPPAALRLAGVPTGARKSGRGAVWNIGTVTAGQSVTRLVTFRVSRTSPSRICNVVEVRSAEGASDRGRACTVVRTLARPSVTG